MLGLIELGLLLAPPTRRFFRATKPPLVLKSEQMRGRQIRVAYVTMAVVALALALIAGDAPFIAMSGFVLAVSLLGAFIAIKQERHEG